MSEILPLDPDNLTPSASLNRLRIVDVPGIEIDPHVRGKTGYDLLSSRACAQLVQAYTADLGLTDAHESDPVRFLDQGLQSDDMRVRRVAEKVGMQLGRHLGYLLAVLKRADSVNRLARADWDASYWKQWAEIRDVFLGGGIVQGRLGSLICEHAACILHEAGVRDCTLHLALHPLHLPLIGAARSAPAGSSAALVFDFGNSFIKRGYALYHHETLTRVWLLPPVRVQGFDPFAAEGGSLHPRLHQFAVLAKMLIRAVGSLCMTEFPSL